MNIETMPVIEELAIEASKDEHESAYENTWVASSRLRAAAAVYEGPAKSQRAEVE